MTQSNLALTRGILWMALFACGSVILLTWSGYTAIREWQRSSGQVAERRAAETADLLVTALTRDMHRAQNSVLSSPEWDDFMRDPPYDVGNLAASAFARYPYPESFFAWHRISDSHPNPMVFLNRSNRPPDWMAATRHESVEDAADPGPTRGQADPPPVLFPVNVERAPWLAELLLTRIDQDASRGRRFSVFEIRIGGVKYQVVSRLVYRDSFREQLEAVFGFTVNLAWVRDHYFPELAEQVTHIGSSAPGMDVAVVDARGRPVVGHRHTGGRASATREFPLLFFDPLLVALDPPADLSRLQWAVEVDSAHDPTLTAAIQGANRTLVLATLTAVTFAVGVLLTSRAARSNAKLAELRSEFVSSVTHELKTPIATIRAVGDSLVSGRITNPETRSDYAQLVVQEAKRLTRLVDNLLAYARITDVTEVYSFEAVDISPVISQVLRGFHSQLDAQGFEVDVDIPENVPRIQADRTAIELMFDNLVDNAIRYSGRGRWLQIRVRHQDDRVAVEISDRGNGIPRDELPHVLRKFFRGRRAGSGGSGLGLAIAYRIVRDHDGVLTIDSLVGSGTTVSVVLHAAASPWTNES